MFYSRGNGLDFCYDWESFVLAWTFNGLEVQTFIWLFSIMAVLPLAVWVVILMKRHAKYNNAA